MLKSSNRSHPLVTLSIINLWCGSQILRPVANKYHVFPLPLEWEPPTKSNTHLICYICQLPYNFWTTLSSNQLHYLHGHCGCMTLAGPHTGNPCFGASTLSFRALEFPSLLMTLAPGSLKWLKMRLSILQTASILYNILKQMFVIRVVGLELNLHTTHVILALLFKKFRYYIVSICHHAVVLFFPPLSSFSIWTVVQLVDLNSAMLQSGFEVVFPVTWPCTSHIDHCSCQAPNSYLFSLCFPHSLHGPLSSAPPLPLV